MLHESPIDRPCHSARDHTAPRPGRWAPAGTLLLFAALLALAACSGPETEAAPCITIDADDRVDAPCGPGSWQTLDGTCEPAIRHPCPAGSQADEDEVCRPIEPRSLGDLQICSPLEGRVDLHVDDDAAPGGDGSEERPFDSIRGALAAAEPGMVVGVGAGRYRESVRVPSDVGLVAACPRDVVIEPRADETAIDLSGAARAHVEGFTVRGGRIGVEVDTGVDIRLRRLDIRGAQIGVRVHHGASVYADALRVSGTLGDPSSPLVGGYGVVVDEQALVVGAQWSIMGSERTGVTVAASRLLLFGSVIEDNTGSGIQLQGDAEGHIEGCAISGTRVTRLGAGSGVSVLFARDVAILSNDFSDNEQGVHVDGDSFVRIVENRLTGGTAGIHVQRNGTHALIANNEVEAVAGIGIALLSGRGEIRGNTIRDIRLDRIGLGDGIGIGAGARDVRVVDNTMVDIERIGVLVTTSSDVMLTGNDVTRAGAPCLWVQAESHDITIERGELTACTGYGIGVVTDTSAVISGTAISGLREGLTQCADDSDMPSAACGTAGIVLAARSSARIEGNTLTLDDEDQALPGAGVLIEDATPRPELPLSEGRAVILAENTLLGSVRFPVAALDTPIELLQLIGNLFGIDPLDDVAVNPDLPVPTGIQPPIETDF